MDSLAPGADDEAFAAWVATLPAPLDYQSNGFWYDGTGAAVGWSRHEDSAICVIDHTPIQRNTHS